MNSEGGSGDPLKAEDICPVTGLPILQKDEWVDLDFGRNYRVTIRVLGGCILHSRPSGYGTLQDAEEVLDFTRSVTDEIFGQGRRYVQIEDYTDLSGASLDARNTFIQVMKKRPRLLGVIFCNTSPLFKVSVKLARRLTPLDISVELEEDFMCAARRAFELLSLNGAFPTDSCGRPLVSVSPTFDVRDSAPASHPEGPPRALDRKKIRWFRGRLRPDRQEVTVDDFLGLLASIDWDESGPISVPSEVKDPSHPLNSLYESVSIIKGDLDKLISEREGWARTLDIERAYLLQLFDNSQIAMLRGSIGAIVQQINPEFTRVFGYTPEEVIGLNVDDVIAPEGKEEEVRGTTRCVEKGDKVSLKTIRRHKDGTLIPVELLVFPIIIDGRNVGAYAMYMDIRESIRAENALRESEERHRSILENMNEGYYEVDLAGNLTFANNAMTDLLGYEKDELIGLNNRAYMDEETARKVYKAFNRVFRTGSPEGGFQWNNIRKDGSRVVVETSVSLIVNADGRPVGFRGLVRDVTERELSKVEKKKLEAQLQHAQRMEAIGTLAGGIAHNFNNILMGIQGNASLVALDLDRGHSHYERLKTIEKLVSSGSKLTSQLLGYAREGRYEVRAVNLNPVIEETARTFGSARREVRVQTDLAPSLRPVLADREQIEQALINLFVNAADAMPEGGELHVTTKNTTSKEMKGKPYMPEEGDYALLVIRDTGLGMDNETRAKIFEPFFTTKGLSKGTGLGLASVYGIVKAHGGYIDVESEIGRGATFEIYLPLTDTPVESTAEKEVLISLGSGVVLLVDDEETVLDVGAEMLSRMGYTVYKARNGEESLRMFQAEYRDIDLVILDMIMPDMGGGYVYDHMKQIDPDVKVLLASGYGMDEKATGILKRGCDDFIQKPFDMTVLSQKLKGIMNRC
ncbi:MAG: PAS domain S-box protein [Desulfatiglandales bacterium]